MTFIASGLMAGLPLVAGENGKELLIFLCIWIPMLGLTALRTYTKTRRTTATTYLKSLQVKKNVLQLCLDNYKHWTPKSEPTVNKKSVVEEVILVEHKEREVSIPDIENKGEKEKECSSNLVQEYKENGSQS
jgi:hypothetical protein